MTDRPILFSGPMVRALLDGRKTQTRRVLKPQPNRLNGGQPLNNGRGSYSSESGWTRMPYNRGVRLWVREAWCLDAQMDHLKPSQVSHLEPRGYPANDWIIDPPCMMISAGRMRSARFMPRWASRLTLIVTNVRVQRLQDISSADAIAEGCPALANAATIDCDTPDPRDSFRTLWDSLNAERGFGWDVNPWVVALTFTVHAQNIDEMREGVA